MILMTRGGLFKALISLRCSGLIALRASSASASAGFAASKSFSTPAFSPPIVVAFSRAASATILTSALVFSAAAVPTVISLSKIADFCEASRRIFSVACYNARGNEIIKQKCVADLHLPRAQSSSFQHQLPPHSFFPGPG